MKRGGFLKRRTPLKAKTPLRTRKTAPGRAKPRKKAPTITKLKKILWELCKQITRRRYGNTCYSCGKTGLEGGNWQTGHFITSSTCSTELRYALDNLRPQCYHCNINLSGNWIAYEQHLKREKGVDFIQYLKDANQKTKGLQYDTLWYENMIEYYTELLHDGKGTRKAK